MTTNWLPTSRSTGSVLLLGAPVQLQLVLDSCLTFPVCPSKQIQDSFSKLTQYGRSPEDECKNEHGAWIRVFPIQQLKEIIGDHPGFDYLANLFSEAMDYNFEVTLTEDQQMPEIWAQMDRKNHSSAAGNANTICDLLAKEVRYRFAISLDPTGVLKLKGGLVQPCGIVEQFLLGLDGSWKLNKRLTYNLSFWGKVHQWPSQHGSLPWAGVWLVPVSNYPFCSLSEVPQTQLKIFLCKLNFSNAYWQIANSYRAAAFSIIIFEGIVYICLRLAFGGAASPVAFSAFSETLTDVSNELSSLNYHLSMGASPEVRDIHLVPRDYDSWY